MATKTTRDTKRSTRGRTKRSGTTTEARRDTGAKRGIQARYPWKEEPNPYFEVRSSKIQGKGAFAIRNIRKGTRLIEYLGQRISWRTADKRYDDEKMSRHHTFLFTVDDKTVIDAAVDGNDARFLNHSCDGNCEAITDRKRIFIEARRNIKAGDELLYDYQYERTDDHTEEDEKFYACRCGSPKCRGSILAPKPTPKSKAKSKR
ncbi:MAG: SET domain-containing protein-lysine N-methyltransferase [Gemmatimonadaceae bacterium]|nr:SET domain-containing protein-lysine N-methyltransferase [Gemmatimonadaceae bacterium]NUO94526.1 SET domain-containing protein-lysine N-methyltransferase [Gemmatimonadaceae bacterium]NUP55607.1 SET domain-containing protein-lysine N-methyltransferase [Gemmatimonadaceae bacterium]NUP70084.1 SET domain-containing protein-lysine N-methyltransferase [Gemmatimonadaceae bacterium]NUR35615.1 SET domain-containing protein-lysine N-methyltransferase [Gemmatimonadaceae bacterium]